MLRKPKGSYPVSICQLDTGYLGDGAYKRKLSLMFFYPSENGNEICPYMDVEYQKNAAAGQIVNNGVNTFCFTDGQISGKQEKYPVVIYNHGLMGFQMESTVLCADIASEGYVVVSIGHPFGAGAVTYTNEDFFRDSDNTEFGKHNLDALGELWKEDILHSIEYIYAMENGTTESVFMDRLELSDGVHLMGVSFGGCCGVAVALQDKRVRDAVNLDGGLFVELNPVFRDKPLLILRSFLNYKANRKLDEVGCTNVRVEKFRKVTHWEFSDGIYFGDKGKNNREWADRISMARAEMCLEFWGMPRMES